MISGTLATRLLTCVGRGVTSTLELTRTRSTTGLEYWLVRVTVDGQEKAKARSRVLMRAIKRACRKMRT